MECRVCGNNIQAGTVTKFRSKENKYSSTHHEFRETDVASKQAFKQKHFFEYFIA